MRIFKKSLLILASGLLAGTLGGCGKKDEPGKVQKDPLVIPTVDVEHLQVTLPDRPVYNTGAIKSVGDYDYLDLYEVSDFHGAVDWKDSSSGEAYPGLARLATYFNQKRAANEGGTILLSSGDMFQGSADSNSTRGFMVNYCMNYMGFDAMAIGNHEFDWTADWIRKNANLDYQNHKIPYLGINIQEKATHQLPDFCEKSVVLERGDYKIGVIGGIGSELESSILYSCVKDYDFVPEKDLIEEEAARLRSEEECDVVVLIEHQGVGSIPSITGVDAIFGGHAHENKEESINGKPALATKNYGRGIAHIELKIDKTTKEVSSDRHDIFSFYNADKDTYAEDAGIKSIMANYTPAINSIKNIELATAGDDLEISGALKNICTKSMFDSAVKSASASTEIDQSKIVAAFHNVNGGIRDKISAGKVTYGSVYSAFPFDNEIVLLKLKGSFMKNKLSGIDNLAAYRLFDTKADLNSNEYYYIAVTDFLALSDNFYNNPTTFKEITDADLIRTGAIVRDIVAETIYNLDSVKSSDFPNSQKEFQPILPSWM